MTQYASQLYSLIQERVRLQKIRDGVISRVFGNYTIHNKFQKNANALEAKIFEILVTSPVDIYSVAAMCNSAELEVLKEWTMVTVWQYEDLFTKHTLCNLYPMP